MHQFSKAIPGEKSSQEKVEDFPSMIILRHARQKSVLQLFETLESWIIPRRKLPVNYKHQHTYDSIY